MYCRSCATLTPDLFRPSTETQRHLKSLQWTLDGLLTDKDKELGIAIQVISPDKVIITLDGVERDSFGTRESPWEIRSRLDFIVNHYILGNGIEFGGLR